MRSGEKKYPQRMHPNNYLLDYQVHEAQQIHMFARVWKYS